MKNNNFYIGMHKTNNLNDEYLGSGTRLKNSIKYHGKKNFTKKILYVFESKKEMIQKETEIVNDELIKNSLCMNLKLGGRGGNTGPRGEVYGGDRCKAALKWLKDPKNKEKQRMNGSKSAKKFWRMMNKNERRAWIKQNCNFEGLSHSEEAKSKIGKANAISQKGVRNSQHGTCWITNEKENKKIKKGDAIPGGWRLGRKCKKLKITS